FMTFHSPKTCICGSGAVVTGALVVFEVVIFSVVTNTLVCKAGLVVIFTPCEEVFTRLVCSVVTPVSEFSSHDTRTTIKEKSKKTLISK
ncbi:MAG: hypothetical protein IJF55_00615, partial [Clostridia bacterium]|nr:hypothetical protein [Clostridia bacterium]